MYGSENAVARGEPFMKKCLKKWIIIYLDSTSYRKIILLTI